MQYYLVKTEECWADEFDVCGMAIINDNDVFKYQALLKEAKEKGLFPISIYFGTNEYLDFDEPENIVDWQRDLIPLSQEEHDVLTKFFGYSWGTCSLTGMMDNIADMIADYDQDNE